MRGLYSNTIRGKGIEFLPPYSYGAPLIPIPLNLPPVLINLEYPKGIAGSFDHPFQIDDTAAANLISTSGVLVPAQVKHLFFRLPEDIQELRSVPQTVHVARQSRKVAEKNQVLVLLVCQPHLSPYPSELTIASVSVIFCGCLCNSV